MASSSNRGKCIEPDCYQSEIPVSTEPDAKHAYGGARSCCVEIHTKRAHSLYSLGCPRRSLRRVRADATPGI